MTRCVRTQGLWTRVPIQYNGESIMPQVRYARARNRSARGVT